MELNYFISNNERASGSVRDLYLDSSSLSSRQFQYNKTTSLTGISGDFSLFFSLGRSGANAGNLISNLATGVSGGFSIGFNSNNELQVFSPYPDVDAFYFPEIRLGTKNCLGIIKSDKRISVLNYDLNSREIYQTQSKSFKTDTNLNGSGFHIGLSSGMSGAIKDSTFQGISGTFDQLVLFNTPLDIQDANEIFSGFLPLSLSSSTIFTKYYEDYTLEQNPSSPISYANVQGFIPFLNYLTVGIIPTGSGNYVASISGAGNSTMTRVDFSGYFGEAANLSCFYTGVSSYATGFYIGSLPSSGSINGFNFYDQVYYSMNNQSERLVSHLFSFSTPTHNSVNDFFSYNNTEKYRSETTNTLTNTGAGYESGFWMNGVVTEKSFATLERMDGEYQNHIGIPLPFDTANQRFMAIDGFLEGYNLYWISGQIVGYTVVDNLIEAPGIVETNQYPTIYDQTSWVRNLLSSGFSMATGLFPRSASIVFSGGLTTTGVHRLDKPDYWETSSLHLIHNQRDYIVSENYKDIYLNDQKYWSTDLTQIIDP